MERSSPGREGWRGVVVTAAACLLLALAYLALVYAGRLVASYDIVTAVWPPTGLAIAAITLGGWRLWPGVALGELLAVTVELPHVGLPIQLTEGAVLAMVAGNTAEAVIGGGLLRRFAGGGAQCFDRVRGVLVVLLVPIIASSVSATAGTIALLGMDAIPREGLPDVWWTWWVGNALGILVVMPILCAWWTRAPLFGAGGSSREAVALFILGGLTSAYAMFGAFPSFPRAGREGYLLFPFLVWVAVRFGRRVTATASFVVCTLAVVATSLRLAEASDAAVGAEILRVQVFMGVVASSTLLLAAAVAERDRAREALRELNHSLEEVVVARTSALEAANTLLSERNDALATANAELDEFAGRVAHDLRGPARAVGGFAGVLRDSHAHVLGPEGVALLDRIVRAATRMSTIVEGLYGLARLGAQAVSPEDVDVEVLVRRVVHDLDGAERAEFTIGHLPGCRADPRLLEAVFGNLLQNALKYARASSPPHVEVGGAQEGDTVTYWVRDNGVGFDGSQAGRLFHAFSRLHGPEFEGAGIGLAAVRRIVEIHGGHVWAACPHGEGATFGIQLPAKGPPGQRGGVAGGLAPPPQEQKKLPEPV